MLDEVQQPPPGDRPGAARWLVAQARAQGCDTISLENLTTLEPRGRGRRSNARSHMGLRGMVKRCTREHAEFAGLRVWDVPARGTSSNCPRCDAKVSHRKYPGGPAGHGWTECRSCGFSADRDHSAGEKIAQRALTPKRAKVRRVKKHRSGVKLAARDRRKTGPTPKRRRASTDHLLPAGTGADAGRLLTPPSESGASDTLPGGADSPGTSSQGQGRPSASSHRGSQHRPVRHIWASEAVKPRRSVPGSGCGTGTASVAVYIELLAEKARASRERSGGPRRQLLSDTVDVMLAEHAADPTVKLTQDALAERAGVSRSVVNDLAYRDIRQRLLDVKTRKQVRC